MSVPSKRTTDTISSIERKKGLYVIKAGAWSVSLSPSMYLEELLYVGKELSHNDKIRLEHLAALSAPMEYAHRLLSRSSYSVHCLKEKLLLKYPECEDLNEIVFRLKKEGLLDDAAYAEAYKLSKEASLYGPNRIIDELRYKKGIHPDVLAALSFAPEEEQLERLFPLLDRKYQGIPYSKKVEKIKKSMIDRGYSRENSASFAARASVDQKALDKRFRADVEKAKRLYGRKYEGYERKQRIIRSLLSKGYSMKMIEEVQL